MQTQTNNTFINLINALRSKITLQKLKEHKKSSKTQVELTLEALRIVAESDVLIDCCIILGENIASKRALNEEQMEVITAVRAKTGERDDTSEDKVGSVVNIKRLQDIGNLLIFAAHGHHPRLGWRDPASHNEEYPATTFGLWLLENNANAHEDEGVVNAIWAELLRDDFIYDRSKNKKEAFAARESSHNRRIQMFSAMDRTNGSSLLKVYMKCYNLHLEDIANNPLMITSVDLTNFHTLVKENMHGAPKMKPSELKALETTKSTEDASFSFSRGGR